MSSFFATISRMKYIERWALMRSSRAESLSEHSLEVAMIAHALCLIGNRRFGKTLDAEKAALISIYHDASEIITGDMPTPVKYSNPTIRNAYKDVESHAEDQLTRLLPKDLQEDFSEIFHGDHSPEDDYVRHLVKAADKISALIKCIEEETAGNTEFRTARQTLEEAVSSMRKDYPEADVFCKEFLPAYGKTLDELLSDK
ncbi:MAG: 5'-deoxynucleotidase [Lachnospiraceae bacterium]|nr:5'-deoxynucleotidase [Lachnospiraceae bacterium]